MEERARVAVRAPTGESEAPRGVRLRAREGRQPLGAVFAGLGLLAGAAVALLHLDRLPVVVCVFKGRTGLPCPTCGSTRALGRLFALDWRGALAMNPLFTAGAAVVAVWAAVDLALLPRRRALALEVAPAWARVLRIGAVVLFLVNWVYLLAAHR